MMSSCRSDAGPLLIDNRRRRLEGFDFRSRKFGPAPVPAAASRKRSPLIVTVISEKRWMRRLQVSPGICQIVWDGDRSITLEPFWVR